MYVPLRVHGHHSMLTGVDAPADLVARAKELGLAGLALADVDTLAGVVDFLHAAHGRDGSARSAFRAVVGAELSDPARVFGRVVALVESETGWRNLCKLVSSRALGGDPGERGALLDGPERFRLIEGVARHQAGLVLLVDDPHLLVRLAGRVDARALFAAISPASLRVRGARRERGGPRNAHLADRSRAAGAGRAAADRSGGGATVRSDDDATEGSGGSAAGAKCPPPARPFPASDLVEAARSCGVATLAVPDVYCAHANGLADHRLRVAIKHNALHDDLPEAWTASAPAHLVGAAELRAWFADVPEVAGPFARRAHGAIERTLEVAARCAWTPPLGGVVFPTVELEPGESAYSRLCALAFAGASRRYRPLRPEVVRRLEHELATIERLGFAPYFLLVDRIAGFAREAGIPCVGRGSAADSLVAYCLALTDADPLRYRLTFERFLNPARTDRPDIDLDFCWRRRDEVLERVYELFGRERTAMIATLNRCGLRSAFRESALALGVPPAEVDRWSRRLPHYLPAPGAKAFDGVGGAGAAGDDEEAEFDPDDVLDAPRRAQLAPDLAANPVALALAATPEASGFPFDDARWRRALGAAAALLDAPRHLGLHPGGVVVAPGPITDFVACHRAAKGVVTTQLDKDAVEAIGLVKMDLLGNRALTVIDDCVRSLAARGVAVDLEGLPEDDARTAAVLREGRTLGCFQVESPAMRHLLVQTGAATTDAVIQAVALIRPGPAGSGMKDAYVRRFRGLEPPTPPHPRLADLLWDTQGVMLYQEDVMQVAVRIAGMDLAEADLLRRALQKREARKLGALCERFVAGALEQGIAREDALRVWDLVANFASFGFCKAHAVTYGRIAYRAVWLKAHHTAEYLAAFLASDTGYYGARVYVEEARRLGVAILPPDVNKSARSFSAEARPAGGALRVGLGVVKGLSERTLDAIFAERDARGAFLSLPDFLERTRAHTDEAERLIQVGAFDAFDRTRPELLWRLHLLRAPERRMPSAAAVAEGGPLDPALLAACRATPRTREEDALEAARAGAGGWRGQGLGLGQLELAPGATARLFPDPETPALALPRLADYDPLLRGRIEHELLGLTIHAHPVALFPCPADERIALCERRRAAGEEDEAAQDLGPGSGPPAARRPAARYRRLRPVNPKPCGELARWEGARITLRGWPVATRHVRTAEGRTMRFLTLEDESGIAEVVLFPDVYERDGAHLAEFGVLCVTGIVESQMGACSLHAERVW